MNQPMTVAQGYPFSSASTHGGLADFLADSSERICRASITHESPCLFHEFMVKRACISGLGARLETQLFTNFAP